MNGLLAVLPMSDASTYGLPVNLGLSEWQHILSTRKIAPITFYSGAYGKFSTIQNVACN